MANIALVKKLAFHDEWEMLSPPLEGVLSLYQSLHGMT